jgi:hypothetical protein
MSFRRPPITEKLTAVATTLTAVGPALESVAHCLRAVGESRQEIARQHTERARVAADARVQMAQIEATLRQAERVLQHDFAIRAASLQGVMRYLDEATRRGNADGERRALDALVTISRSSSFAALRDTRSPRHALPAADHDDED